ncbi:hypothetical protein Goshw_001550 [Gossypium schwendimanii]|uniref:Uncharacterized protein n=1 Tax=Gossypium schwendimanii TaxID=34291 RepID=A0A7J9L7B5_GOSSC|nr:hypothetical protein [Gossypium schwendimanii]
MVTLQPSVLCCIGLCKSQLGKLIWYHSMEHLEE